MCLWSLSVIQFWLKKIASGYCFKNLDVVHLQIPDGATIKVLSRKSHLPLTAQRSVKGEIAHAS